MLITRRLFSGINRPFLRQLIQQHLQVSNNHLTPEIALYLMTPKSLLWTAHPDECPVEEPFWAFYWPGGQALTRFVLDQPSIVENKHVLDLGCGCGSLSIAAKMGGAKYVVANDIDPVAIVAAEMNMENNSVTTDTDSRNLLDNDNNEQKDFKFDTVFIGDMFYDPSFASMINSWIAKLSADVNVFIGDPGRLAFKTNALKDSLQCVSKYELSESSKLENNGLTHAGVWQVVR